MSKLIDKSFVSTIIRQSHKLSNSTVPITSRPVSSGNLLHIANRRVETTGTLFNQHNHMTSMGITNYSCIFLYGINLMQYDYQ